MLIKCPECEGWGEVTVRPIERVAIMFKSPCPLCEGSGKVQAVVRCVECAGEDSIYMIHGCGSCPTPTICKNGARCPRCPYCHEGYRPLAVDEVIELQLISESYEGHATQTDRDWIAYHGLEKLIETYLGLKSNPMTELTLDGQPVKIMEGNDG